MVSIGKVESLLQQFTLLKAQENEITEKRRRLAAEIAAAFGYRETGSSKTYRNVDGYKVTVKVPINSRMDWKKWSQIEDRFTVDGRDLRPVEMKPVLSEPAVKWLRDHRHDLYTLLAEALVVTPGQPQVQVERTDEQEIV